MGRIKSRIRLVQILEGIEGMGIIVLCYFTFFLSGIRSRWGLSKAEASQPFPADELIPRPLTGFTHSVIIQSPLKDVWPWIAQIGQGRFLQL